MAQLYHALQTQHQQLAAMQQTMAQSQEVTAAQSAQIAALQNGLASERDAAAVYRAQIGALQSQMTQAASAAASASAGPVIEMTPATPTVVRLPPGVKPPQPYNFHGERDINTLEHWMFTLGEYFRLVGMVDEEQRIQYTGLLLRGAALAWYRSVRREETVGATWDAFMADLRANFCPINATKRARDRLATIRQTGTLQEFVRDFRSVCLEIPGMTDEEKLDRFMRALQPRIRAEVDIQEPKTLDKAITLAERLDAIFRSSHSSAQFHRHAAMSRGSQGRGRGPAPMELGYAGGNGERGRSGYRGTPSRRPGQLSPQEKERLIAEGRCLYCKEHGHIARNCPKKTENGQGGRAVPKHRSPSPTGSRA